MENQLNFQVYYPRPDSFEEIFHRLFILPQKKQDIIEEDTPVEVIAEIIAKRMMEAGIQKPQKEKENNKTVEQTEVRI